MRLKLIILMSYIFLSLGFVQGFGVSSDFDFDSPVEIDAGETRRVGIKVENEEGSDIKVASSISEGGSIASILDSEYFLPAESEREISVEVNIPEDYRKGTFHTVGVAFRLIESGPNGELIFEEIGDYSFSVKVSDDPIPAWKTILGIGLVIGSLVLLIMLVSHIWKMIKEWRERKGHYSGKGPQYRSS